MLPSPLTTPFIDKDHYKVLITDLIGITFDLQGQADFSQVRDYIVSRGGIFHRGEISLSEPLEKNKIHFYYQPYLSCEGQILSQTSQGQFDACICAATIIPSAARFDYAAVRIGAGTGNMLSNSWGGANGLGGCASLMNTPSYNSRATAQSVFKSLLKVMPNLACDELHNLVIAGNFDTGKDLANYPCTKLEGKRLAVIGYGNIGREVAKLGAAFGMLVKVYAREKHQRWIESEGFEYASSIIQAATDADVISPHLGLGALQQRKYSNVGIISTEVFSAMKPGSVLINYDRGELVDIDALDSALESGQISYAAIDADIFKDPDTGEISGPMLPYTKIYPKHSTKMQLLPHAAADTEHVSRVAGAKQAVDQIFSCILQRKIINLVGDLPPGVTNSGKKTVPGIGKVRVNNYSQLEHVNIEQLKNSALTMAKFWQSLSDAKTSLARQRIIEDQAAQLTLAANTHNYLLRTLGLQGPFES